MSKIGVSIKIDVTKILKERLYKGQKGTYLDLTTIIDLDEVDQYGNNGFISQSVTKEEREQKFQTPILGNAKVFWRDDSQPAPAQQPAPQQAPPQQQSQAAQEYFKDDPIPF